MPNLIDESPKINLPKFHGVLYRVLGEAMLGFLIRSSISKVLLYIL